MKERKIDRKNSKNISRSFSGVVVGIVGSVHFRLVPWSGLYFSRSIGPFLCSWYQRQGFHLLPVTSKAVPSVIAASVCWSLQCLVSALTQRVRWWTHFFFFQAHLFSRAVGREGRCKQITLVCARSASATLGLPPFAACVSSLPTLLRL